MNEIFWDMLLNWLLQFHLYLKLEKCEFHQPTIQFLGYIISPEGIQMKCTKVEAVKNWTQPHTIKDLQRFLGFANFYHWFMSGYSEHITPLNSLLRKKPKNLNWTSDTVEAFWKLKAAFCTAPTLLHPDPTWAFIVEVDASPLGVGAVLSQWKVEPPGVHPCVFFAKKWSLAEQNYEIGNWKLLAIKLALKEWQHWLMELIICSKSLMIIKISSISKKWNA